MATVSQNRRWVRSSVQEWLEKTFPSYHFNFGNKRTSIEDIFKGLPAGSVVVLVDWLKRGGQILNGARVVVWPIQLTVLTKLTADQYGTAGDNTVTALVTAMAGKRIPFKDYTDPAHPVTTDQSAICLNVTDDDLGSDDVVWAVAVTAELNYAEYTT